MGTYPEFFQEHRLAKREKLIENGINPYPYSFSPTHTISELLELFTDLETAKSVVTTYGRVLAIRKMGKSWFVDIIDYEHKFQLYVHAEEADERAVKIVPFLDIGDWAGVTGILFRTRSGEPTILVRELQIIGKSVADVPFGKQHDGTSSYALANIEMRRQKRYLDWITDPDSVKRFELRSRIISLVRHYMEEQKFLEVDTPTLEAVYGGAEARPFVTQIHAFGNRTVYLNISLELPLKRYIIGGFPRVFALAKCFRNEGVDATHNPEFTMIEWYEAFTDYEDQMKRFEDLTCFVVEKYMGSLKIEFQGRKIDLALEARLVDGMSDEKLSFVGITRDEYRIELSAEKPGALVMKVVEEELESSGRLWDPCFICDHPRDISPLTKIKRGNPNFVERFEPHIATFEMGNAYSELTDPVEQYERFLAQRSLESSKDYEEYPIDMDFIHAIACGMPPTGGVGYGIDRLVMLLTGKESIRDVIPFPMRM